MFLVHRSGSSVSSLPEKLSDFIVGHADELTVSIAGRDEQLSVPGNQVITLLEMNVPESLMPQARDDLGAYIFKRLAQEPLLRLEIGPRQAFQQRELMRSQRRDPSE